MEGDLLCTMKRVGKRIKFVRRERQVISRLLREANDAEDTLSNVVQASDSARNSLLRNQTVLDRSTYPRCNH